MGFSSAQMLRYSRQVSLPKIGVQGQAKLLGSKVLVIGAGGLGSPALLYLTAAGVGTLGIVDADTVEMSNLQRQIVHSTADLGRPKTISAKERLLALNPDTCIITHTAHLDRDNATAIIKDYDFVIDATDNFPSKFLIAEICGQTSTPYSHAGILRFGGQTITVIPGRTACYGCIFEPSEEEPSLPQGPLGVVPGVIGTIQATEAIKYLLHKGDLLTDRLLVYDALKMRVRIVPVKRNKNCPLCGDREETRS